MARSDELVERILKTIRMSEWDDCPSSTMMELRQLEAEHEVAAYCERTGMPPPESR